jgi:hypothetical protein
MQHVLGSCSCFPYFETEYNSFFACLPMPYSMQQHTLSQPVIKTKRNVRSAWNKMACVANGQDADVLLSYDF